MIKAEAKVSEKKCPPCAIRIKERIPPNAKARRSPIQKRGRLCSRFPTSAKAKKKKPVEQCPQGKDFDGCGWLNIFGE